MSLLVTDFKVVTQTLTNADTVYSVELPRNTQRVRIQARAANDVKLSAVAGAAPYWTIKAGTVFEMDRLTGPRTLHLQSAVALTVVEIALWH